MKRKCLTINYQNASTQGFNDVTGVSIGPHWLQFIHNLANGRERVSIAVSGIAAIREYYLDEKGNHVDSPNED